jgi:hypothetical protein
MKKSRADLIQGMLTSIYWSIFSSLLHKNIIIDIYRTIIFAFYLVWVWNLVVGNKEKKTMVEGVWEQGAEGNIWA